MSRPLIIDSFAGGGGASEGIRAALGRDPDYALNHNPMALAMHRINHPDTHHIEEDVWDVDAIALCAGRPVGLLWMSPDCKHFSKAKGGKPREKAIRGLAWVGVRWIKSLPKWQRPRVVYLENVEEFQDWGPLLEDGRPCPVQKGETFKSFVAAFRAMGYAVEWRELRACDYGAPTIRKRLFLVARRDRRPIVWPAPTHGGPTNPGVIAGRLKPWRTAAEIIDWSLPCPSIFETSAEIKARYGVRANRPLADATMARIAKGTWRYVITAAKPFLVPRYGERMGQEPRTRSVEEPAPVIVPTGNEGSLAAIHMTRQFGASVGSGAEEPIGTITAGGAGKAGVVAAFLAQHNTERDGAIKPGSDVREPVRTVTASGGQQTLVAAHMLNLRGSDRRDGPIDAPVPTVSAGGNHAAAVYAFLQSHYGSEIDGQAADSPIGTETTKPRHGVVTVTIEGQPYAIVDIGMRMLTPRERFSAQGFRPDYVIDRGELEDGTIIPLTLEQQGAACGNSVCPDLAHALVAAHADALDHEIHPPSAPVPMPLFAAE